MLTQVTAAVGTTAEQVRASLILVADEASARALRAELEAGADFAVLARNNSLDPSSRPLGGDLDWIVRGQLTLPEVEAAAFALEPGQLSDVIPTALGYALVRVEARDPARLLTNDQSGIVRQHAVDVWLQGALAGAVIETFVTP
jgi:parvulin-like peptidyl-prolyl isomerase